MVAHGTFEEAKRPCGTELPMPHAYALLDLLHHGQPMTVSELAARLSIDRTNVSRLCARMEDAGELARDTHPEDGRVRCLRLTTRGKQLAESVDKQSARHFQRIAEELGSDAARVITSLVRLSNAMKPKKDSE